MRRGKNKLMLRKSLLAVVGVVSIVSACAKESDTPAAAPAPYVPPAPTATQPLPQPAVTAATPAPVATVPAAAAPAGTMATPGAFALPCTSDASCGLARCNVQFQKCAFPCAGPVDCAAGAACNVMTGLCLPGAAPQ